MTCLSMNLLCQFGCQRKDLTHFSTNRSRVFTSQVEFLTMATIITVKLICIMAVWTSFARLSVKIAHVLFVFIAVAQLLQSPLSKDHRHLARKASKHQVSSELARPAVNSVVYGRSKTTSESMASAPRWLFCCVIALVHELA